MKRKKAAVLLAMAVTLGILSGCGQTADALQSEQSVAASDEAGGTDNGTASVEAAEGTKPETASGEPAGTEEADEAGGEQSASEEIEQEVPVLKETVTEVMGCRIGAAATEYELNDKKVWEIITTHFNALTLGNELKPDALFGYSNWQCPGTEETELNGETLVVPKLDYSRAERMLDKVWEWNKQHPEDKILVRGHVLVWHSQTPEWFFHVDYDKNKDYVDKETMDKRLEWYIKTVLTHFTGEDSKYKELFYGWDVVNEAVSDGSGTYRSDCENPSEPLSNDTHGSNSSWWHVYQSNEYILNAFRYANKYAPESLELYYNDYNECETGKMKGIEELLTAVKEAEGAPGEGTRITAMGMQGHYSMTSPSFDRVELAIKRYAAIVGNVQITEFDLKARDGYDGSDAAKEEEYQKQATRYKVLYTVMQNLNKEENINVTGITFWGTADHYSWLQTRSDVGGGADGNLPQCPLLFDENYEPKPAFYVFAEE